MKNEIVFNKKSEADKTPLRCLYVIGAFVLLMPLVASIPTCDAVQKRNSTDAENVTKY